jgi:hypothetical protein
MFGFFGKKKRTRKPIEGLDADDLESLADAVPEQTHTPRRPSRSKPRPRHDPLADALGGLADESGQAPRPNKLANVRPDGTIKGASRRPRPERFDFEFAQIDKGDPIPRNQWYRMNHWRTQSLLLYRGEWDSDWKLYDGYKGEAKVVGITHEDRQRRILKFACRPDFRVGLAKDPENPYDPNAITVWAIACFGNHKRVEHIGYLDRDVAKELAGEEELDARPCKLWLPNEEINLGFEISVLVRSAAYKKKQA